MTSPAPEPRKTKVYALNLFDIADREEYLACSSRTAREVARHGGHVLNQTAAPEEQP